MEYPSEVVGCNAVGENVRGRNSLFENSDVGQSCRAVGTRSPVFMKTRTKSQLASTISGVGMHIGELWQ